ncbi:nonstructural protein [Blackfly microvirus SF02]|uniref:Nonstructural protein n=1 Tax=Blackfly microvirus SF02 TaxID=2576452 RepID=A0A4P8PKQ0_9VIRU|nr:nonstructural protein [Blackfly microvirus SF02]
MILTIVATRDIKANAFAQPQFVQNIGHYMRAFSDEVNRKDENNLLWKHPEDFEIYELGKYDDNTAEFILHDKPKQLGVATNYVITKQ